MKSKAALSTLGAWTDRLVAGKVPAALQLDVLEAATAAKDRSLTAKVDRYKAAKPKKDALAAFIEALEGGDAVEGEILFKSGQCTQCHAVGGVGGAVGPDLSHVASRLDRRRLLQSIVDPQAEIAEGFATISVTDKDGDTTTGTIQKETADELTVKGEDGQVVTIRKSRIDSRTKPSSAMPPMTELLKPGEIRDIVEYLKTLK